MKILVRSAVFYTKSLYDCLHPWLDWLSQLENNLIMPGYLNHQPGSTYFDGDGYGMTGDIGYYDETGALHYVDRMKELVK